MKESSCLGFLDFDLSFFFVAMVEPKKEKKKNNNETCF